MPDTHEASKSYAFEEVRKLVAVPADSAKPSGTSTYCWSVPSFSQLHRKQGKTPYNKSFTILIYSSLFQKHTEEVKEGFPFFTPLPVIHQKFIFMLNLPYVLVRL